jgi:hypothetical protein
MRSACVGVLSIIEPYSMFAYLSTLTELGCLNCTVLLSGVETQFMADSLLHFVGIHLFVVFALKKCA